MDATRVLLIGVVAGARVAMPLALLARRGVDGDGRIARVLRSPWAEPVTAMAAAGELAADKLPAAPNRLDPGALGGRVAVGALAGAALGGEHGGSAAGGALLGAVGAVVGAYGLFHARRIVTDRTPLNGASVGVIEDAVVLALGRRATTR